MTRSEELTLKLLDGAIGEEELNELEWLIATDAEGCDAHVALLELEGVLRGRSAYVDFADSIMAAAMARAQQRRAAIADDNRPALDALSAGVQSTASDHQSVTDERATEQRRVHKRGRRKHRKAPVTLYVITALFFLAVIGTIVALQSQTSAPADPGSWAKMAGIKGSVALVRGDKRFRTKDGAPLKPGEGLELGANSGVHLLFNDETVVAASNEAKLHLDGDPAVDRPQLRAFQLNGGELDVTVVPDSGHAPVAVTTPHAVVSMTGAQATIAVSPARTRVDVSSGSAQVNSRFNTSESVHVNTKHFTIVERGLPLVAKPLGAVERVTDGVVAMYRFQSGKGATVHDNAPTGKPMDLTIVDEKAVQWSNRKLQYDTPTVTHSQGAATKLYETLLQTNAMTIEAWLNPKEPDNAGPSVIFAMASGGEYRNFQLEQAGGKYRVLLRTTQVPRADRPIESKAGSVKGELTHLVYVREGAGAAKIYINGTQVAADRQPGAFDNWAADFPFSMGNVVSGDRPWVGAIRLAAIYNRALTPPEVKQNFTVGITDSFVVPDRGGGDASTTRKWVTIGGDQGQGARDSTDFTVTGGAVRMHCRAVKGAEAGSASNMKVRVLGRDDQDFGAPVFQTTESKLIRDQSLDLRPGTYYFRIEASDDFSWQIDVEEHLEVEAGDGDDAAPADKPSGPRLSKGAWAALTIPGGQKVLAAEVLDDVRNYTDYKLKGENALAQRLMMRGGINFIDSGTRAKIVEYSEDGSWVLVWINDGEHQNTNKWVASLYVVRSEAP